MLARFGVFVALQGVLREFGLFGECWGALRGVLGCLEGAVWASGGCWGVWACWGYNHSC